MGRSKRSKNYKQNMRNVNKRSPDYKTKAELKKERKDARKQSQMENKILIGFYDNYRKNGILNNSLNKIYCTLIGTYSTEPDYSMYELLDEENCILEKDGNTSVKVEVWEINQEFLDKIQLSYKYYPDFQETVQEYKAIEVMSPFGKIKMFVSNVKQDEKNLVQMGDWIEYAAYQKILGQKIKTLL